MEFKLYDARDKIETIMKRKRHTSWYYLVRLSMPY